MSGRRRPQIPKNNNNNNKNNNQKSGGSKEDNGWSVTQGGKPIDDMKVPERISGQFIDMFQKVKGDHKQKFDLFDRLRDEENW